MSVAIGASHGKNIMCSEWYGKNGDFLMFGVQTDICVRRGILLRTISQGLLYTWTDSLGTFFATFVIIKISVNDTNTICRSSKSITFPKIWRVWLKN